MSNFDFLQKEWPLVAKLAQTAENYIPLYGCKKLKMEKRGNIE